MTVILKVIIHRRYIMPKGTKTEMDDFVDSPEKQKSTESSSVHKRFLSLMSRVRASFSGTNSEKVYHDAMPERPMSAPPTLHEPLQSESSSAKKTLALMSSPYPKGAEKTGNICCNLLRHGDVISHVQKRDFIIDLMRHNVSCLDFQKVPLTTEASEEKWNRFFAGILKYHPSIVEIKPPKGIRLNLEVTDYLAIHKKLAQVIEYDRAAKTGASHNSDERKQQRKLAAEVIDGLRERWAFESVPDVWQGELRRGAIKKITQQTLDAHDKNIDDVYTMLNSYASMKSKHIVDDESDSLASTATTQHS